VLNLTGNINGIMSVYRNVTTMITFVIFGFSLLLSGW